MGCIIVIFSLLSVYIKDLSFSNNNTAFVRPAVTKTEESLLKERFEIRPELATLNFIKMQDLLQVLAKDEESGW